MTHPLRHYETPLLQTPFHPRTAAANKLWSWGAWAGYATALTYEDLAMEHSAIRNAATVYDLCPMIKYRIAGPDAPGLSEPPDPARCGQAGGGLGAVYRLGQ